MTFGEKLQKLRKEKGWTQEELAGQISISRQALSKWEVGSAMPDTDNVLQISRLFGVSTDYLLNDDYESDEDIPVVHTSTQKVSNVYNNRIRILIGGWICGVSLFTMLIMGIIGSVMDVVYIVDRMVGGNRVVTSYTGLSGFLKYYHLEWFFGLLVLVLLGGVVTIFYPKLQPVLKKIKK